MARHSCLPHGAKGRCNFATPTEVRWNPSGISFTNAASISKLRAGRRTSRSGPRLHCTDLLARQHRKKSVPARRASVDRHLQQTPDVLQFSFAMLRGNSLQLEPAAPAAMNVSQKSNRHAPGKKAYIAVATPPRPDFRHSINVVKRGAPPRTLAIVAFALRTNQSTTSAGICAPKNRPAAANAQQETKQIRARAPETERCLSAYCRSWQGGSIRSCNPFVFVPVDANSHLVSTLTADSAGVQGRCRSRA